MSGAATGRCAVPGCGAVAMVEPHGLCETHYRAFFRSRAKYPEAFTEELLQRFDRSYRVDASGCWMWTSYVDSGGYPILKTTHRHWLAFRYSFLRFRGDLKRHRLVLHTCGNLQCVNPEHLLVRED